MLEKVLEVTRKERARLTSVPPKPEKIDKGRKLLQKAIAEGNWGCRKTAVKNLVSAITGLSVEQLTKINVDDPKAIKDQRFLAISSVEEGEILINLGLKDDDGDGLYISSSNIDFESGHYLQKSDDILATDEEIKEWFKEYFS